MHYTEELLPRDLVEQHLAQLRVIANALTPTDPVQALINSNTALQYPQRR